MPLERAAESLSVTLLEGLEHRPALGPGGRPS